jgi:peptidoglycan/LPS O-acetylase OafA/YrhL
MTASIEDTTTSKLQDFWSASYFPALDGLRALCLIMVIFNHVHARVPAHTPTWVGVDIFFVLSGFLITTLLVREREKYGNVTLKGFYTRRACRILPVYFVVLLSYVPILRVLHDAKRWADFKHALPYLITFTQEFRPDSYGTVFGHTWSLGYEEKFYLVWPFLLLFLYPFRGRKLWAVFVVGALLLLLPHQASRAYGAMYFGALLAVVLDRQHPNAIQRFLPKIPVMLALLLVVASFQLLSWSTRPVLVFSACVTILTGSLVLNSSWLRQFLAHPVTVLLGKRSYSMYLVHILCLDAIEKVARPHGLELWYVVVPATFLLAFLCATGLFYLVEQPCIAYGRRLSKGMRTSLAKQPTEAASHSITDGMPVIEREEEGASRAY